MNLFKFIANSLLLGFGLAMDAFSVSVANGINEPKMRMKKAVYIAGAFGFFQMIMPLIGWICVKTAAELLEGFEKYIPWAALILLTFIGGKMIIESLRADEESEPARLTPMGLFVQGIATSIDALTVGFTIADYNFPSAFASALIIGIVTFGICMLGLKLGKKLGMKLASKAGIFGGVILILIGLEIFFT
ncbi:Putative Mn2+ efflux pump MntP [Ruminococcaceae bacterium FB2012]|nr:Putative Mn2+ efflux pump MntP [Ruminococcaceae bacterium FB2012]